MSDYFITVIPSRPEFVPNEKVLMACRDVFQSFLPYAEEVEVKVASDIVFVDQGENFESVLCPICSGLLPTDWWQRAMSKSYESRFHDLSVVTPCCGHATSLNDLDCQLPAGFAHCWLRARNPRIRELNPEQLKVLEEILGTSVRQIFTRC